MFYVYILCKVAVFRAYWSALVGIHDYILTHFDVFEVHVKFDDRILSIPTVILAIAGYPSRVPRNSEVPPSNCLSGSVVIVHV